MSRILIDARLYGIENTGLGRYVLNLVNRLAVIDKKNDYLILLRKKYFKSLRLPGNWQKVLCDIPHYSLNEQISLPKIISDLKPDLVHFPHFNVPIFYSKPFVVTIHDILMHRQKGLEATTLPAPAYLIKRIGYHRVFKHAVEASVKIIVPSQFVREEILGYYKISPAKVVVTYEGFDEKIKNVLSPDKVLAKYGLKKPYFIYAGNAYPHKNLARLIEAFANLDGRAELAIVSARNVFIERLEKLVYDFKAEGTVKLLGFVPDDDLGVLYAAAEAFVFPSFSEGFGLPGLEAMATGTLVLASKIAVLKEVYQDNALYFDPHAVISIQKAIDACLGLNKRSRRERIEKAKRFAKRYSWDKMARETLKLYENCSRL